MYRVARIVLKHYADRIYIEQTIQEHEQRMRDYIKDYLPTNPVPPVGNHYLMQYARPEAKQQLWLLLVKMEKYRLRGSFEDMSHYTFDLDSYYKTEIYALWSDILLCLQMKKMGLAKFLMEFTNIAEKDSLRTVCNHL